MKLIKAKGNKDVFEVIKIENFMELIYIETLIQYYIPQIMQSCVNSPEPPYRYNHLGYLFKGVKKAIFLFCLNYPMKGNIISNDRLIHYSNPLLSMHEAVKHYLTSLVKSYERFGSIHINLESGGMFLGMDDCEIIKESEIFGFPDEKITMENFKNTSYYQHE